MIAPLVLFWWPHWCPFLVPVGGPLVNKDSAGRLGVD